jgi:hypothetical protein
VPLEKSFWEWNGYEFTESAEANGDTGNWSVAIADDDRKLHHLIVVLVVFVGEECVIERV